MKKAFVAMDGYEDVECVFLHEEAAKAYVDQKKAHSKSPWNYSYVEVELHEAPTWPA